MVQKIKGRVIMPGTVTIGANQSQGLEAASRQFYSGTSATPHSLFPTAVVGSVYLDTAAVTFYLKTSAATWSALGSLTQG
jgi:hypothetical protein